MAIKPSKEDLFASLLSANQQRIFGYILGLVRNTSDAQDILQQTAVTAWRKFDGFEPDSEFLRWAVTIARFETMNFIKYRRRSRLYFDQELMEQLGEDTCEVASAEEEVRLQALGECLKKLPATDSKLIECRYTHGLSSLQIAELFERPQPSICNSLRRIRENLMRCISRNLAQACGS
jgi:RNA polymerase sigma-70 factor, ECF subfamily